MLPCVGQFCSFFTIGTVSAKHCGNVREGRRTSMAPHSSILKTHSLRSCIVIQYLYGLVSFYKPQSLFFEVFPRPTQASLFCNRPGQSTLYSFLCTKPGLLGNFNDGSTKFSGWPIQCQPYEIMYNMAQCQRNMRPELRLMYSSTQRRKFLTLQVCIQRNHQELQRSQ